MEVMGVIWYSTLVFTAFSLCWLTYLGYSLAGHILILWVGAIVLILPILGVIPDAALLTIYSLACFALLAVIAAFLPKSLTQQSHQKNLRRLLQATNQRLDNERKRLASAIHDEINPQLILARLEMESMNHWIEKSSLSPADKTDLYAFTFTIRRLIQSGYDLGRSIINESRAEILESIGLLDATRGLVDHYASVLEKIHFVVNLPKEDSQLSLSKEQTTNLFSIIREGVLNAVKHANASEIDISIQTTPIELVIDITDNGNGVIQNNPNGLGLIDMQERAIAIGAELSVTGKLGKGTVLRCRLPRF